MTAAALIEQAGTDGMKLWANGDRLAYEGPTAAVEYWKPILAASKPGIMSVLNAMAAVDIEFSLNTKKSPAASYRYWLLHFINREPLQVAFFPAVTFGEILERHPGAIVVEPIHRAEVMAALTRPIPDDMERLIRRAAAYWQYSPDDLAVIQQAAQRDPEGLRLALENDVAFVRQKESAPAITGRDQA